MQYANFRIYRKDWAQDRADELPFPSHVETWRRWHEVFVPDGMVPLAWRIWQGGEMSDTLQLFTKLFEPFSDDTKKTKRTGGRSITFVEWVQYIIRAHQEFPEGFDTEIRNITEIAHGLTGEPDDEGVEQHLSSIIVVVRVTDRASGMYHESTGMAPATKDKATWGGAAAEAESQALRRAFAHFGLGLEMYLDDDEFFATQEALTERDTSSVPDPVPGDDPGDEDGEDVVPMTDTQRERLEQYKEALLEHVAFGRYEADKAQAVFETARNRLSEATDRKAVAGILIREMKEWAERKGLSLETSGEA